jgi:hypothetical protein
VCEYYLTHNATNTQQSKHINIQTDTYTLLVPLLINHIAQRDENGILAVEHGGSGTVTRSEHNPDGDTPTYDPEQFGHFAPSLPNEMPWGADLIPHARKDIGKDKYESDEEDDSDEDTSDEDTSDEEHKEERQEEQSADHKFIDVDEDDEGNTLMQCDAIDCGRYRTLSADTVRAEGWAQEDVHFFCTTVGGVATL